MRLPFSFSGTAVIVRRFSVTFSPVRPSPRVAPIVKRPLSYCSEIARPSSLGSATKRIGPGTSCSMRVPHASSSSRENALSSESIGTRCSTGANVDAGRPPGRCVGESGVTSSGCCRFERAQLAHQRVELRVGDLGRVEHEVLLVVVLDQLAQLCDAQLPRRCFGAVLLRAGHAAKSTDRVGR